MSTDDPRTIVGADAEAEAARGSSTLFNAAVGAAISVLLLFFVPPFSTLVGGVISGYLQGGDVRSGAWIGAVSGFLTTIPILLLASAVLAIGFFVPEGLPIALVVVLLAGFLTVFVIGLSVVGGAIGVYLKEDVFATRRRSDAR